MSEIHFDFTTPAPAPQTFERMKSILKDGSLSQIDSSFTYDIQEKEMKIQASGRGIKAEISIQPQGNDSRVEFAVRLPLMLRPFKSKIESQLKKQIEKMLN